ncbi:MAG: twin-arginine translocase subunit TatC [candidate division Zixibacteria bacterium]|nr:twin-arginine translocase subunit TatC [candidate division Zixibacteria bacterium]
MVDEEHKSERSTGSGMGFLQHLEELRRRLLKAVITVVVMSAIAFYFSDQLIKLIKIPFGDDIELYNIAVTGAFYAYLKVSIITGILVSLPVIFFQMWAFVAPGLYRREKTAILPLVFISTVLFAAGAVFCYLIVLPLAFDFLIGFSEGLVVNTITIGSYISFVGLLLVAFGFGFQLPVLAYFLGKMGFITSALLCKGRRFAIVGILIAGAIITPPDVFTQFLLAVPLYILYEVSIIVVRLTGRREKTEEVTETSTD